ncbi:MAG: hypothetical protein IS632_09555 [Thaumarchaeota archaeon]|nr:hypothetical protein [Nitrososphaerota archaeon]
MQSKSHTGAGDGTRHITLRIPDYVAAELESDSARIGISVNSMTNKILKRWVSWDRYMQTLEVVPVPKQMIPVLVPDANQENVQDWINGILPIFQEAVMLIKGKYDLKHCIETLEDYMRVTGIATDHKVDGQTHTFTVRHGMGTNWSIFIKAMLGRLFGEFMPNTKVEYEMQTNTISVRISLDSGWTDLPGK